MKPNDDVAGLPHVLREMFADGWTGRATYDQLYRAVMSGLIPAEPVSGTIRRLGIRPKNFSVVGEVLGLTPPNALSSHQHVAAAEQASV